MRLLEERGRGLESHKSKSERSSCWFVTNLVPTKMDPFFRMLTDYFLFRVVEEVRRGGEYSDRRVRVDRRMERDLRYV